MAKAKYDPEMRKSEHGRKLYQYWKSVHRETDSKKFETFPGFYDWAMQNGYTIGAKLFRYNPDEPFGPDNCFWVAKGNGERAQTYPHREFLREKEWDKVVNRIRKHYGMEPIFSSDTLTEV